MSDETRVVLVKPGDVLLVGNVRVTSREQAAEAVRRFRNLTGISAVMFFADDIQLDLLTAAHLRDLAERADTCATKETT